MPRRRRARAPRRPGRRRSRARPARGATDRLAERRARRVDLGLGLVRRDLERQVEAPGAASSPSRWSSTGTPVATLLSPRSDLEPRAGHHRSARSMLAPRRAEPLVDPLVAAVDLADVPDRRLPLGGERRDHHRHPGADVRALEPLPVELARARDDDPVRVAEDDPRAHRDELVDEEQPVLEHLLEDEHGASRLCRDGDRDRGQVGGERGPDAALDLRDLTAEVVLDVQVLARPGR